ncbi:N-acetylmuramoyl-L-alanine amidase [Candidatus Symbiothrix dinenymphae]|nr:N-acetylmuramoyl-L-alanine amidase [Candidatus Symbiothrix dinenymphae]
MKKRVLLILLTAVLATSVAFAKPAAEPFVVVLDAGHGGKDPGSLGKKGREKDITLAVALHLGKYITERHSDVKVVYTRENDTFVELDERANIANRNKADLFISIHTNSARAKEVRGSEVYSFGVARADESLDVTQRENNVIQLEENYKEKYDGFDPNSAESYIIFEFMQNKFVEQSIHFATQVQNMLKTCVDWKERGVKQAQFLVLRKSAMPRVLIELDFISNTDAEKIMMSEGGRKMYAKAIYESFAQYKYEYDRKTGDTPRSPAPIITSDMPREVEPERGKTEETRKSVKGARIYKVQLFSSSKELAADSPFLKGYAAEFYVENGDYKYTYGASTDKQEIFQIKAKVKKDFQDAFVVTFEDGKRVN